MQPNDDNPAETYTTKLNERTKSGGSCTELWEETSRYRDDDKQLLDGNRIGEKENRTRNNLSNRRSFMKKAAAIGTITIGSVVSLSEGVAAGDCYSEWDFDCEIGSSDPRMDAHVKLSDYDSGDNRRACKLEAYANVDDSCLKHEKITVRLYEKRCSSGECSWTLIDTTTAKTGDDDDFCSGNTYDTSESSESWKLYDGSYGYSVSADEYKMKVKATTYYNPRYYPDDWGKKTRTCQYGPYTFCSG